MNKQKLRKKQKLGSYPFVSVSFSIMIALVVLGIFGWLLLHSSRLASQIQENIELQVYLNKDLSKADIRRIESAIVSKHYILVKEVPQVRLVTQEEAAKEFIALTGEDFKEFLGANPLRDLFTINLVVGYQSVDSMNSVKNELEKIRGVFEVEFEESLVESIHSNITKLGVILIGISLFAIIFVVILINNTIKLALFSQRFLIRSMQLVGATDAFIQRPFLLRAILYGLIAGIFASGIIYGLTLYLNSIISGLSSLQDTKGFVILFGVVLLLGTLVGYLSSLRAIRKYLKMSLDELY